MHSISSTLSSDVAGRSGDRPVRSLLLLTQGLYFAVLGVWPIIDIRSFQAVSGPKTDHLVTGREADHWLVITMGSLITAIGISLLVEFWSKQSSPAITTLAIGSALSLAAVDIVYVSREVIDPIYLADAAIEIAFACIWFVALYMRRRTSDLSA
jgi:hypothetical protein